MSRKTRATGPHASESDSNVGEHLPATPAVIVTTDEQLGRIIDYHVRRALSASLPETVRRATAKEYLTRAEVAELFGCSIRHVDYLKDRGELPYIKRGSRLVLFESDVAHAYLNEGRVSARAPRRARSGAES